jgi:hypothetical protein
MADFCDIATFSLVEIGPTFQRSVVSIFRAAIDRSDEVGSRHV